MQTRLCCAEKSKRLVLLLGHRARRRWKEWGGFRAKTKNCTLPGEQAAPGEKTHFAVSPVVMPLLHLLLRPLGKAVSLAEKKWKKKIKKNKSNPSLQTYLKRPRYDYFIHWLWPSSLLAKEP